MHFFILEKFSINISYRKFMKVSSKEFGRLANVSIEALRQAVKNKN
ncbi:hypothetical protein [Brachyspira innocens]|nr:hypothetical protein [Brachyspira innocens]